MTSPKKATVIFQPSGRRGEIEGGKTLLEAAQALGVPLESVCGGKKTCGKCKVRIQTGEGSALHRPRSPFTAEEEKFISKIEQQNGYRLACGVTVEEDISVFLPEESRGSQQVIRKEAREISFDLDPAVQRYPLELIPPTLENPEGDLERLRRALRDQWGLTSLTVDFSTLQTLPQKLRSADWKITVFVWMDREIIDVQPGNVENYYGIAVDIGTTTLAAYLCNLKNGQLLASDSMMNPQVAYGEDVMSRISYSMTQGKEGLDRLHRSIIDGLNGLIQSVASGAGIPPDQILELTVVGNTAMHHLFLGIDPHSIGLAPFPPALHQSLDIKARDLGLRVHPAANVHVLPIEAGFVGADNVGVLIAQRPYEKDLISLIIDIGTNGELILGNRERLLSCSCATGPALEGGHLRFGMRAAPGAIERVRIEPTTLEVRFKVIGQDEWNHEGPPREAQARGICGSGIIEAVAEMFKAGVIIGNGRFNGNLATSRMIKEEKGPAFIIARAEETALGQDITISIADIRAVQLAKGALYAGAKIMMGLLGIQRVDQVLLAGGFGSYIDCERAMVLGMFPDCNLKNVLAVGNAAGDGARLALLDRKKRDEANRVAREVEYIELTTRPEFTTAFIEAMPFPHMKDPFPHLLPILGAVKKP
jgi:uncharacterized 2Fe-2S/4Fe-4S cluster protein (DUF4445 family)